MIGMSARGALQSLVPSGATFPTLRSVKVSDPTGQTWRVSRRWVPWRRRARSLDDNVPDLSWASGIGDDPVSVVISLVALVLLAPFVLLVLAAGGRGGR